jgi:type II secretory pathway pseudopilin PulG
MLGPTCLIQAKDDREQFQRVIGVRRRSRSDELGVQSAEEMTKKGFATTGRWPARISSDYSRNHHSSRPGFTIVEMIGTCLLMGILFSMTVPMLLLVAHERRSTEQRQFALQHAANLLENASARGWSELPVGSLPLSDADSELQGILPGLERSLVVNEHREGEVHSRQVTVSIRWQSRSGNHVAPLRLSTWVHPTKEVP